MSEAPTRSGTASPAANGPAGPPVNDPLADFRAAATADDPMAAFRAAAAAAQARIAALTSGTPASPVGGHDVSSPPPAGGAPVEKAPASGAPVSSPGRADAEPDRSGDGSASTRAGDDAGEGTGGSEEVTGAAPTPVTPGPAGDPDFARDRDPVHDQALADVPDPVVSEIEAAHEPVSVRDRASGDVPDSSVAGVVSEAVPVSDPAETETETETETEAAHEPVSARDQDPGDVPDSTVAEAVPAPDPAVAEAVPVPDAVAEAPRVPDPARGSGPGEDPDPTREPAPGKGPAAADDPRPADDPRSAGGPDRMRETPLPDAAADLLGRALAAVREGVTGLRFGLDLPGAEESRRAQEEILAQLDDYVIPRVRTSTAPALVVIAGSTGAGKSTLLNSLAGARVSPTGVRRPTTATPVLACHPDDRDWFAKGDVLGSLRRQEAVPAAADRDSLVLVPAESLPAGMALLDTPDIDSVVEENHEIAHRMLDVGDLWIFVTTAARYADAPVWRLLRLAKERGAELAIVLSRVPPKSRDVVTKHFFRMLAEYGLGEVERFVVDESKVTGGMLPAHEVADLHDWLTGLSIDERRRARAVQATLSGVLDSFRTRMPALARQLEFQVAFRGELRRDVDAVYGGALAGIEKATGDGSLLCGEVLARWQDFAGSGDLMRTLHLRRPGRFAGKAGQQAPERLTALKAALRAGLESVVISAAQRAAEEAVARWLQRPGTDKILAAAPDLGRASDDLARRTGRTIAAWQDHITELIRTEGVTKRSVARLVSFDVESLALVFTVGLLGQSSAETGTGTGTLPQRLVNALLGAESVRTIGARARSDLRARIGAIFDDETSRHTRVLDGAGVPDESAATRLYQAAYNLEVVRAGRSAPAANEER